MSATLMSFFADKKQAAGGIISASLLSTPGASKIYRGGLTVPWADVSTMSLTDRSLVVHARVSYCLCRMDGGDQTELSRSYSRCCVWAGRERQTEARLDLHCM